MWGGGGVEVTEVVVLVEYLGGFFLRRVDLSMGFFLASYPLESLPYRMSRLSLRPGNTSVIVQSLFAIVTSRRVSNTYIDVIVWAGRGMMGRGRWMVALLSIVFLFSLLPPCFVRPRWGACCPAPMR